MPKGTTKKTHRYNFGRLKLFIVVGVLIYVFAFLANHHGDLAAQMKRQDELTQTQSQLEQEVQYYTNELDYIGTDEYVEQEARNRFGWLKDGEIKYVEGNAGSSKPNEISEPEPSAVPSEDAAGSEHNDASVATSGTLSN